MPQSNLLQAELAGGAAVQAASPAGTLPRVKRRRRGAGRVLATEVLMLGPSVLLVSTLVLIPVGIAVMLSFTNWDGFTTSPAWVGEKNYVRLFQDESAIQAVRLTALITLIGTVLCNTLGLGFALILNENTRINAIMRVLVFYPYVIGSVIIGFLWSSILGSNGAINALLVSVGAGKLPFLSQPEWAIGSLIAVLVWSTFGINVVLYLSGLQTIPETLIEAAKLDGASSTQILFQLKIPLLAPTITVNVVLGVIGFLRVYELILSLTAGGPAGATESVVYNILSTSFSRAQLGYAAAQSIILLIVIAVATLIITVLRRKSEEAVAA